VSRECSHGSFSRIDLMTAGMDPPRVFLEYPHSSREVEGPALRSLGNHCIVLLRKVPNPSGSQKLSAAGR
jgi:hypothetical protein